MRKDERLPVALIGAGHWGPFLARSLEQTGKARLAWVCDRDPERAQRVADRHVDCRTTTDLQDILDDRVVTAVAVATPANTHQEIVTRCLEAGRHVLAEKPLTTDAASSRKLVELARRNNRVLMVGHVFEYNASIRGLKEIIDNGELGELFYLNFERTNLGPVRLDVNALWDLATHDISILRYLLGKDPVDVSCVGRDFLHEGVEDTVFLNLGFGEDGPMAQVHASWLNPRKVRQITVVGSRKMAVWDDLNLKAPIKLYDKRVEADRPAGDDFIAYKTSIVDGGMFAPSVRTNQPLEAECAHFIDCVRTGGRPLSDGYSGLRVVTIAECAQRSLAENGARVPVPPAMPGESGGG
ncbi:MAG: Gfo/Idh/MocA family oxidoreductase [Gammaproteobacteria bacterium]|jgi:predicted dehydrogenase|nr:Gfo/Idh/MocA family oxidoreductase [Gammaproteobacteria bacterium]